MASGRSGRKRPKCHQHIQQCPEEGGDSRKIGTCMKIQLRMLAGLGLAFCLGYAVAALEWNSSASVDAAATAEIVEPAGIAVPRTGSSLMLAGAFSGKCSTRSGTCTIPRPQEVGSSCTCPDGTRGIIVR